MCCGALAKGHRNGGMNDLSVAKLMCLTFSLGSESHLYSMHSWTERWPGFSLQGRRDRDDDLIIRERQVNGVADQET